MIYIASPYSSPNTDLIAFRVKAVAQYAAHMMKLGYFCISPVLVGTTILQHVPELPTDFNFWQNYSFNLLTRCDMLAVMKLHGWKESTGVQAEISYAKDHNIKIDYVDVDYLMDKNIISKF